VPRHLWTGPSLLETSRAMLTLITLLQALIVSGTIVGVTYCLMHLTAYCVLCLIEISFKPCDDPYRNADKAPLRTFSKMSSDLA
jgi:hypothetical protein